MQLDRIPGTPDPGYRANASIVLHEHLLHLSQQVPCCYTQLATLTCTDADIICDHVVLCAQLLLLQHSEKFGEVMTSMSSGFVPV